MDVTLYGFSDGQTIIVSFIYCLQIQDCQFIHRFAGILPAI